MDNTFKIYGTEDYCIFKSENDLTADFLYLESYAVGVLTKTFENEEVISLIVKSSEAIIDEAKDDYRGMITLIIGSGTLEMMIAIINACYKVGLDLFFLNPTDQKKCEAWSKFY